MAMTAHGALACMVLSNFVGLAVAEVVTPESERPAALLRRQGIEPSTAGVLAFLRQQEPNPDSLARITALVKQLGDNSYDVRERAMRELGVCGRAAVPELRTAEKSDDLEVSHRARRLLRQSNRDEAGRRHEAALAAALQWLKESPTPQAAGVLLQLLPHLDASNRHAACEALWACAGPANAEELRTALRHPSPLIRAAAIPALELASGEAAVDLLLPFLQDADESLRLAAARALIDRRPRGSVAALIGLLDSKNEGARAQAGWLLQQVSGIPPGPNSAINLDAAARQWKTWAAGAERFAPVGRKRLVAMRFGSILTESFADDAAEIQKTYHLLDYERTNPGARASVAQGRLRLHGDHEECDQRLFATAEKLLGAPCFPPAFRVKAALGGEDEGAGAWHVGVSVGNVRVLFHPGMEGGAFRAERVDNHQYLLDNQSMPFTPRGGVLHDMTIDVERQGDGSVRLDVTITDGSGSGAKFTRTLTLQGADIGELRRIGLERSGRTGGAALFRSFEVLHRAAGEPGSGSGSKLLDRSN